MSFFQRRRGKSNLYNLNRVIPKVFQLPKDTAYPPASFKVPPEIGVRDKKEITAPDLKEVSFEKIVAELSKKILLESIKNGEDLAELKEVMKYIALATGEGIFGSVRAVTVSTSATKLIDEASKYRFIKVTNNDTVGTDVIYVSPNSTVTVDNGYPLFPGNEMKFILMPEKSIWGVSNGNIELRLALSDLPVSFKA
jgi:hypothetical protein